MTQKPSEDQKQIISHPGNVFVDACPGSGKTFTMGLRAKRLAAEGQKVCMLSFSNVAATEISSAAMSDGGAVNAQALFVGTLHAFAYKYVLVPFAHLVTGFEGPPKIDDDSIRVSADAVTAACADWQFDGKGSVEPGPSASKECKRLDPGRIYAEKRRLAGHGFIQLNDAIYWSNVILQNFPALAVALAARFNEIIVDECQDCNAQQLAFIGHLKNSRLRSLVLVGDLDQSIYKFQNAVPKEVKRFTASAGLERLPLRTNYRSSEYICGAVNRLLSDVNRNNKHFPTDGRPERQPLVVRIPTNRMREVPQLFQDIVERDLLPDEKANNPTLTILGRNGATLAQARGSHRPTSQSFVDRLYSIAPGQSLQLDAFMRIEQDLRRKLQATQEGQAVTDADIRAFMVRLRDALPPVTGSYSSWAKSAITSVNTVMQNAFPFVSPFPAANVGVTVGGSRLGPPSASNSSFEVTWSTIHSAKGISRDAVLVLLDPSTEAERRRKFFSFADKVAMELAACNRPSESEDLRLFYVALTRARSRLILGVPEYFDDATLNLFTDLGFGYRDIFGLHN